MTKKDFKGGLDSLLGETSPAPDERTQPIKKGKTIRGKKNQDSLDKDLIRLAKAQPIKRTEITKTTQEGTYEGEIRATFIIKENKLELLKALAYWERKKIKDLLDESIDSLLQTKDPELLKKVTEEYNKTKK